MGDTEKIDILSRKVALLEQELANQRAQYEAEVGKLKAAIQKQSAPHFRRELTPPKYAGTGNYNRVPVMSRLNSVGSTRSRRSPRSRKTIRNNKKLTAWKKSKPSRARALTRQSSFPSLLALV